MTTATIINRIFANRKAYEDRNAKKVASEQKYYKSKQHVKEGWVVQAQPFTPSTPCLLVSSCSDSTDLHWDCLYYRGWQPIQFAAHWICGSKSSLRSKHSGPDQAAIDFHVSL